MRFKISFLAAVLILAAGLLRPAEEDSKPNPSREDGASGRLVRMDLLRRPPAADVRVRRNIFLVGRPASEPFAGAETVFPGEGLLPDVPAGAAGTPSTDEPVIRYLGWVTSARKAVGLIDTGREVLAVSEGETFGGGFIVRSIGPETLELETPEGRILKVSIEGGRQ